MTIFKPKKYKFHAWVHPKEGGDDYKIVLTVKAPNLNVAKKTVESHLSKVSDINKDYCVVKNGKCKRKRKK